MNGLDLAVVFTTFVVIFLAELPDKTFVATLVLSTRFRPLPVWVGVTAAFGVQCLIAVTLGGVVALLPRAPVLLFASALFAVGSVVMFRSAGHAKTDLAEEEREVVALAESSPRRAAVTSFLVLSAAEWGDLSQIVTAGLAASSGDPLSVFAGAWLALALVAALAVLVGNQLAHRLPLSVIRRSAGVVFAILSAITFAEGIQVLFS